MIKLETILKEKKKELEAIINKTKQSADKSVDVLRISAFRDKTCYYKRPPGTGRDEEQYAGAVATPEIAELARIDYEKRLHKAAVHQVKQINRILPFFKDDELSCLYADMAPSRKKLFTPLVPDDETFAREWEAFEYQRKPFDGDFPEMYSERGERVRSKSEKIIADYYLRRGIPYRYECPLKLLDGSRFLTFHPDFTVLNKRTRQVYYHEHLGLIDDDDYREGALWKLDIYEKNGLFPGKGLLLTYESEKRPLNMSLLDKMTEMFLL